MKIEFINIFPDLHQRDYVYPMLGIPIVAGLTPAEFEIEMTFLEKNGDFVVKDVDILAVSVLTHHAPFVYQICQKYRQAGKKVILGGIHPSVLPQEALQYADAVIIGEAELVWKQALNDFKQNNLQRTYKSDNFVDMSLVPNARLDLMNDNRFHNRSIIHASRGCPFECSFCSVTNFFGNTYRFRRIDDVIAEIVKSLEQGFATRRNIIFNDDNIACNKKYAKELFTELKKLNITWSSQANLFIGDDLELLKMAAESGCISLFVGIESLSPENLKGINKSMNHISKYEQAIKRIHDYGIVIIGSFIFGLDFDTEDVFDKTLDFIDKNDVEVPSFSVLTPFPGTQVFREFEENNRLITKDWSQYDMAHVVYRPVNFTPERLAERLEYAYNSTAFRRSRGIKRIMNRAASIPK